MKSNIIKTQFGTIICPAKAARVPYKFKVNRNVKGLGIDSALETKIFLKDSFVQGAVWHEKKPGMIRKVVKVENYLIPLKELTLVPMNSDILSDTLGENIADLTPTIEKPVVEKENLDKESFLDQKFGNFTGKELLIGTVAVIILIKLIK